MTPLPTPFRPSWLVVLDQCPQRAKWRMDGWQPLGEPEPHSEFGTVFHACAEIYDQLRFQGWTVEEASLRAIGYALADTWDWTHDRPLWGTLADEWSCQAVTVSPGGRRKFGCDGARDWWIGTPAACPKCGGPVSLRTSLVNAHPSKHRLNLLRAVAAYCDAEGGLVPSTLDGLTPALEVELEFTIGDGRYPIQVHWDRYSALSDHRYVHERKTTGRYLGRSYWQGYEVNMQVAVYDLAAHKLGIPCDGVMLEAIEIRAGGVRIGRQVITRGPEQRDETEQELLALIEQAELYHATGHWPRRTASCAHAAGGRPCEFIGVCAATPSARAGILARDFRQEQKQ